MFYLFLGFILGFTVSLLLKNNIGKSKISFWQIMNKELAVNGQAGSLENMKRKLELMERKLLEMEKRETLQTTPDNEIKHESGTEIVRTGRVKGLDHKRKEMRKTQRSEAIKLWNEGKTAEEIANKTMLGKGEVELILSLCSSRQIDSWNKEQVCIEQ